MKRGRKLFVLMVCLAAVGWLGGSAFASCVTPTGAQVIVWHAGSLSTAFTALETAFTCDTGIAVVDNSAGSLDMIREIVAGGQPADVVAPADYQDIDLLLKPGGYANYTIKFAQGQMVLAYCIAATSTTTYPKAVCGGASGGVINFPHTSFSPSGPYYATGVPAAPTNWYSVLTTSYTSTTKPVVISTSNPNLDPSGYRAPMIFNLAQIYYDVPNLYNDLLEHVLVTPASGIANSTPSSYQIGGASPVGAYDYSITYEHSAYANWQNDPNYFYVTLPEQINLGYSSYNTTYNEAVVKVPDVTGNGLVTIPGTQVVWGVTILKNAPNQSNAVQFLKYLLEPAGPGQTALIADGPEPINVPSPYTAEVATEQEWKNIPAALQGYVYYP